MPIYEYRCVGCGHELEAMQKISEAPLTDCPACQASQLKKKISPVAFRLKGSGWYETDFKSGQQKNVAAAEDGGGKQDNGDAKDKASGDAAKPAGNGKGDQAKDGKESAKGGEGAKAAATGDAPKAKPSKNTSESG